jgi:SAM-dependent methyltransferase
MNTNYGATFFEWVNLTARRSALAVIPLTKYEVRPSSVLDVGCGQGVWLAVWSDEGIDDQLGLDGAHVNVESLLIPRERFRVVDLRRPWDVGRQFDLVQSLEVAEHLPPDSAEGFVRCLCAHGDVVLFSAAQPGQGGERHINERRPSYWARFFSANGFAAFDCIRPLVARNRTVDPWYRFNTLIYANAAGAARLRARARASRVDRLSDLDRGGDLLWRVRRLLLRPLPEAWVTLLSRLRYRVAVTRFKRRETK